MEKHRGKRIFGLLTGTLISMMAYAQAQAPDRPYYNWHGDWTWGWGHVIFGSIMMILFWGTIILLIVLAVRWLGGGSTSQSAGSGQKTALDILKERFARGEIDKTEFEERKHHLSE